MGSRDPAQVQACTEASFPKPYHWGPAYRHYLYTQALAFKLTAWVCHCSVSHMPSYPQDHASHRQELVGPVPMFSSSQLSSHLELWGKGTEHADQEAFHVLFPFAEKLTFYM